MGNGIVKFTPCFSSDYRNDVIIPTSSEQPSNDEVHSFSYGRQGDTINRAALFPPICGVAAGANLSDAFPSSVFNDQPSSSSSSFDSSNSISLKTLKYMPQYFGPVDRESTSSSASSSFVWQSRTGSKAYLEQHPLRPPPRHGNVGSLMLNALRGVIASAASKVCLYPSFDAKKQPTAENTVNIGHEDAKNSDSSDEHWVSGKAGQDGVHVVLSKDHGWLFVGIYDGFTGQHVTDYLIANLYSTLCDKLGGVFQKDIHEGHSDANITLHQDVLDVLAHSLRETEDAYFCELERNVAETPEVAMMGSCVLVMLMKGKDVYLMNVGDSRAVLAQKVDNNIYGVTNMQFQDLTMNNQTGLAAVQLTVEHTTANPKEVQRIKKKHQDDPAAVLRKLVKGKLRVTRAFGAGYLKEPRWNNALLPVFAINYVGTKPYITCQPHLHYHRLNSSDRFLILSSDGLYQYFTNEDVVAKVEKFMSLNKDGDPAQHLVEDFLSHAVNVAGMELHDFLQIPLGDRRGYHDDVSIVIISLDGKIWKSSVQTGPDIVFPNINQGFMEPEWS